VATLIPARRWSRQIVELTDDVVVALGLSPAAVPRRYIA
jgi:hypothetical protein